MKSLSEELERTCNAKDLINNQLQTLQDKHNLCVSSDVVQR